MIDERKPIDEILRREMTKDVREILEDYQDPDQKAKAKILKKRKEHLIRVKENF